MVRRERRTERHVADFLASVAFLIAVAVLILNDFALKRWAPGILSGKLSDVAGPLVLSLLLVAGAECIVHFGRRDRWARPWWFAGFACLVVAAFAVVKLTSIGGHVYAATTSQVLSIVQWVVSPIGLTVSTDVPVVVPDTLDVLVALAAIPLTFWVGWRWRGPVRPPAGS